MRRRRDPDPLEVLRALRGIGEKVGLSPAADQMGAALRDALATFGLDPYDEGTLAVVGVTAWLIRTMEKEEQFMAFLAEAGGTPAAVVAASVGATLEGGGFR